MSSTHTLIILVNSLTKTEKRYFHLYSNLQSGDKVAQLHKSVAI